MKTTNIETLSIRRQRYAERHAETSDSDWDWLYRIGGAASLLVAVCIPIQILVFIIWPPPLAGSAGDWFTLFQHNRLIGLIDLDLLLVADNVLGIPIALALYCVFRRYSQSLMAIATVLGLVGVVLFITSNPAVEMSALSDRYAAATTEAQRATYLAAGEAVLASWQGTAFHTGYIISSVAWIVIPAVMLRSAIFGKTIAYLGILANTISLGLYVPGIGIFLALGSVVFLETWYILLAQRLFQLGAGIANEATNS